MILLPFLSARRWEILSRDVQKRNRTTAPHQSPMCQMIDSPEPKCGPHLE